MKSISVTCISLLLIFGVSCNEDSVVPLSFEWTPSKFSKYGSVFYSFATGDDGLLYAYGYVNNQPGFHKFTGNTWETIIPLDWSKFNVYSFTVFKQHIYFTSLTQDERALWRINGTDPEKINYGNSITEVSHLNGKLIVSGDFVDVVNKSYGLAVSDDGANFTPVAPMEGSFATPGYNLIKANKKIFVRSGGGYNVYEFDGVDLKDTGVRQSIDMIDAEYHFYTINYQDGSPEINKLVDGKPLKVGPSFKNVQILNIFLKDNILIAIGINPDSNLAVAFYLDNNQWKSITTTNHLTRIFEYSNQSFAFDNDGIILELSRLFYD